MWPRRTVRCGLRPDVRSSARTSSTSAVSPPPPSGGGARGGAPPRPDGARADGPMWPPAGRAFLSANFVNLGRLRAAGQWLKDDGTFTIAIPGQYVVLNAEGVAPGLLNGTPNSGARMLGAGAHRFEGERGACVVWAPAYARGHSPFH